MKTKGLIKTSALINSMPLSDWKALVMQFIRKGGTLEYAKITEVISGSGKIEATITCENLNLGLWDDIVTKFITNGFTIVEIVFADIELK